MYVFDSESYMEREREGERENENFPSIESMSK